MLITKYENPIRNCYTIKLVKVHTILNTNFNFHSSSHPLRWLPCPVHYCTEVQDDPLLHWAAKDPSEVSLQSGKHLFDHPLDYRKNLIVVKLWCKIQCRQLSSAAPLVQKDCLFYWMEEPFIFPRASLLIIPGARGALWRGSSKPQEDVQHHSRLPVAIGPLEALAPLSLAVAQDGSCFISNDSSVSTLCRSRHRSPGMKGWVIFLSFNFNFQDLLWLPSL